MRDYELREIGSQILFNGQEWEIESYGESVDYFCKDSDGNGMYLDEYQLSNSKY